MFRRLQIVALGTAIALVLVAYLFCFFCPQEVGRGYTRMRGLGEARSGPADWIESRKATETGSDFARRGRLDLALDQFSLAVVSDPRNANAQKARALIHLALGDHESYRRDCNEAVCQFAETDWRSQPYLVSWTCCLTSNAVADYAPVLYWAEESTEAYPEWASSRLVWGAALYRAGHCEQAAKQLTEADTLMKEPDSTSESPPAYTWYFLAMVHHKLEHTTAAKKWLDKATKWTDEALCERDEGKSTLSWNCRLTLQLLREEAEEMIGTGVSRKDSSKPEQGEQP